MSTLNVNVGGNTAALSAAIQSAVSRGYTVRNLNVSGISQPLGRITGQADEFTKSLEASNARVIAFGASAGAIYAIRIAFEKLVTSTIEVEKSLTDINSILGLSSGQLATFSAQLFTVANQTATTFQNAALAATEFSRQGLSAEETILRTRDALILARLSGLGFEESVSSLTAAVNSFGKEALTTSEVVNRLATVDAAFSVSSNDLAQAIKRVGSSAQDANVSLNQTIALVTAAQQTTSRGGAVIGNSFKTIFTRLQRPQVLSQLEAIGVKTRDAAGNTLPLIEVLKGLASQYDKLNSSQKSHISELVGGVYQINILKAVLGDLGGGLSIYESALRTAERAADAANRRNDELNTTLSSKLVVTLNNVVAAAAKIGDLTIAPTLKGGADIVNSLLGGVGESLSGDDMGAKIGRAILSGIGNVLQGPGLQMMVFIGLKLMERLTRFGADAASQFSGMNAGARQHEAIQASISNHLAKNPALVQQIFNGTTSIAQVQAQIVASIQQQNALLAYQKQLSASITTGVITAGVRVLPRTPASGFIPNFNSTEQAIGQMAEDVGARGHKGGYTAGTAYPTTVHDGNGNSFRTFVNSREKVETFTNSAGYEATMVTPPNGFGKGTMRAASGFIPNFALKGLSPSQVASLQPQPKRKVIPFGQLPTTPLPTTPLPTTPLPPMSQTVNWFDQRRRGVKGQEAYNRQREMQEAAKTSGLPRWINPWGPKHRISKAALGLPAGGFIPNLANTFNLNRHLSQGGTFSHANKPDADALRGLLNYAGIPYGGQVTSARVSELLSSKENKLKIYRLLQKDPIDVRSFPESHKVLADGNNRFALAAMAGIKNVPKIAKGFIPNFYKYPQEGKDGITTYTDFVLPENDTLKALDKTGIIDAYVTNDKGKGRNNVADKVTGTIKTERFMDAKTVEADARKAFAIAYGTEPNTLTDAGAQAALVHARNITNSKGGKEPAESKLDKTGRFIRKLVGNVSNIFTNTGFEGVQKRFGEAGKNFDQKTKGNKLTEAAKSTRGDFKNFKGAYYEDLVSKNAIAKGFELTKGNQTPADLEPKAKTKGDVTGIEVKAGGFGRAEILSKAIRQAGINRHADDKQNTSPIDFKQFKVVTPSRPKKASGGFIPNFSDSVRNVEVTTHNIKDIRKLVADIKSGDNRRVQAAALKFERIAAEALTKDFSDPNRYPNTKVLAVTPTRRLTGGLGFGGGASFPGFDTIIKLITGDPGVAKTLGIPLNQRARVPLSTKLGDNLPIEKIRKQMATGRAVIKSKSELPLGVGIIATRVGALGPFKQKHLTPLSPTPIMANKGFIPNFAEGSIGKGRSSEAHLRYKDGKPYVVKAPHKRGSERPDAVAHAKDQVELSRQYKKALERYPWFNVFEQEHVGGGVLKQSYAKGQPLGAVLSKAYPSKGGAGPRVAEDRKSGALGSFQKFFGKSGLPYDRMGMARNILVPEEHQQQLVQILKEAPGHLYAKLFGNQGGGLPKGSLNVIDFAKGFVPNFALSSQSRDGFPSKNARDALEILAAGKTHESELARQVLANLAKRRGQNQTGGKTAIGDLSLPAPFGKDIMGTSLPYPLAVLIQNAARRTHGPGAYVSVPPEVVARINSLIKGNPSLADNFVELSKLTGIGATRFAHGGFVPNFGRKTKSSSIKAKGYSARKPRKFIGMTEGFVPNFTSDALSSAIDREKQAGIPPSEIRVGRDSSLITRENPLGTGVFNTGEGSLRNGISLAKDAGFNPQNKGMSGGFIPNFAQGDPAAIDKIHMAMSSSFGLLQYLIADRMARAVTSFATAATTAGTQLSQAEATWNQNNPSVQGQTAAQRAAAFASSTAAGRQGFGTIPGVAAGTTGADLQARAQRTANDQAKAERDQQNYSTRQGMAMKANVGISLASGSIDAMDDSAAKTGMNTVAKGASMAAGVLTAIPGPWGAAIAGGVMLVTAVMGAAAALTNIGEEYKAIADVSQKRFQEVSSSLQGYSQALHQLTESYGDASVSNETILKLQKKVADGMMNISDPGLKTKLMTAGSPKAQQRIIAEVQEEEARLNAGRQLTSTLATSVDEDRNAAGRRYHKRSWYRFDPTKTQELQGKENLRSDSQAILTGMSVEGRKATSEIFAGPAGGADKSANSILEAMRAAGAISDSMAEVLSAGDPENLKDLINKIRELNAVTKQDAAETARLKTAREANIKAEQNAQNRLDAVKSAIEDLARTASAMMSRGVTSANFREDLGNRRRGDIRGGTIDATSMAAKRQARFFGTEEQQATVENATAQAQIQSETTLKAEGIKTSGRTDIANAMLGQLESRYGGTVDANGTKTINKDDMKGKEVLTNIMSQERERAARDGSTPEEMAAAIKKAVAAAQGPGAERARDMFKNINVQSDIQGAIEKTNQELANLGVDQLKQMEQTQRQHLENLAAIKTERNIKSFGGIQGFMQGPQYEREQRKNFGKGLSLMGSENIEKKGRGAAMVGTQLQDLFGGGGLSSGLTDELQSMVTTGRKQNIESQLEKMAKQADRKGQPKIAAELRAKKKDAGQIAKDQAENAIKRDQMPDNIAKQVKLLEDIRAALQAKLNLADGPRAAAVNAGIDLTTGKPTRGLGPGDHFEGPPLGRGDPATAQSALGEAEKIQQEAEKEALRAVQRKKLEEITAMTTTKTGLNPREMAGQDAVAGENLAEQKARQARNLQNRVMSPRSQIRAALEGRHPEMEGRFGEGADSYAGQQAALEQRIKKADPKDKEQLAKDIEAFYNKVLTIQNDLKQRQTDIQNEKQQDEDVRNLATGNGNVWQMAAAAALMVSGGGDRAGHKLPPLRTSPDLKQSKKESASSPTIPGKDVIANRVRNEEPGVLASQRPTREEVSTDTTPSQNGKGQGRFSNGVSEQDIKELVKILREIAEKERDSKPEKGAGEKGESMSNVNGSVAITGEIIVNALATSDAIKQAIMNEVLSKASDIVTRVALQTEKGERVIQSPQGTSNS